MFIVTQRMFSKVIRSRQASNSSCNPCRNETPGYEGCTSVPKKSIVSEAQVLISLYTLSLMGPGNVARSVAVQSLAAR